MPLRLEADRAVCVGAGMCVLTAPELFDQDSETGTVVLLHQCPDAETEDAAREAVALCPSGALTLVGSGNDDTGQNGAADDANEDAEGESNG